jgi:O-acetylserine/cysteine efflux transporter
LPTLNRPFEVQRADLLMTGMVFVWGFHFIVVKDAVENIAPLTFSALRFLVGLPLILLLAWSKRDLLHFSRRDVALVLAITIIGSVGYQAGFALGIKRTTSTNTALLVATMPTWTALFSILVGMVEIRRQLLAGVGITLGGVVLVIYSRSGHGLALSHDDLVGSMLVLGAAMVNGVSSVWSKPVVDRLGGMPLAISKYCITTAAMTALAAPDLFTLSGDDLPIRLLPNVLYSGILSGVGGFIIVHYALYAMDPTRSTSYFNFNPIVAAFAGIVILGEPFSLWLLAGGVLTVAGVVVVRNNVFMRRSAPAKPADSPDEQASTNV